MTDSKSISPENINNFSVSRIEHFKLFNGLPFQSYNVGDPDPAICDLKVYQDYLMYCFIAANIPKGSRILDVGGGDSRVLRFLSRDYECWNVDKCEGMGNGPVKFKSPHYRIVYDYLGNFNAELRDGYFDFVFSVSALEHTPEDQQTRERILTDLHRILKPHRPTFHCFDCALRPNNASWVNGLIPFLYERAPIESARLDLDAISADPNLYVMSKEAYETHWMHLTNESYETFGRPFSLNLLWRRPDQSDRSFQ